MASRPKFPSWTPIAARERDTENVWVKLQWIPYPDAVYTPEQARVLAACRTGFTSCIVRAGGVLESRRLARLSRSSAAPRCLETLRRAVNG